MRRKLIVAAIAAAAVAAQPGTALGQTYSANGSFTTPSGNKLNQGSNARVLAGDATTVTISLECFANTSPPASGTGVRQCYVKGADGSVHEAVHNDAMVGPVSVTGNVFRDVKRQHYRVCVQAAAIFYSNSELFAAPLICSA